MAAPELNIPLFILCEQTLYFLGSLRDAAMAQWMDAARGWTVFKEHFATFDKEVLQRIEQYYPVQRKRFRK